MPKLLSKAVKEQLELEKFSDLQHKEIEKLTIDNHKLKQELKEIKALLKKKTENIDGASDEESICIHQLQLLREKSDFEALTLEECRKTETYVKILLSVRNKKDVSLDVPDDVSTADLMNSIFNADK